MTTNYYNTLISITGNLFSGKYCTLNDIQCGNDSTLKEALKFLLLCYEELMEISVDYRRRSKPLIVALKNWIRQHKLVVNPNFASIENDFSYSTMKIQSGFLVLLEMIVLIEGIDLPQYIRDNTLLGTVIHAAGTVASWTEDLVNIRKDVEKDIPAHMNAVTWKVDMDDQELSRAFYYLTQCQQAHAMDYQQFKHMLQIWFHQDQVVDHFVKLLDCFVDGLLIMWLRRREGFTVANFKIKDVFVCKSGDEE